MKNNNLFTLLALLCLTFSLPLLAQTPQWKDITPPGFTGNYRWCAWANHSTAVACSDSNWLYLSTDTGKTFYPWKRGNELGTVGYFRNNIGISVGTDTVLRSTDGGKTWNRIEALKRVSGCETMYFKCVHWKTDDSVFVTGVGICGDYIYVSPDKGQTWHNVAKNLSYGLGRGICLFYFTNQAHGYAYSMGYYIETFDGGKTWKQHDFNSNFDGISEALVLPNGNVLAVMQQNGVGASLTLLHNGETSVTLGGGISGMVSQGEHVYYVDGKSHSSSDTGKTWQQNDFTSTKETNRWIDAKQVTNSPLTIKSGNAQGLTTLACLGKDTLLLCSNKLTTYRSVDGGKTWTKYQYGAIDGYKNMACKNSSECYITGSTGRLFRTKDGGTSWQFVDLKLNPNKNNDFSLREICFPTRDTGYISCWRGLLRSTDGGSSWKQFETYLEGNYMQFPTKDTGYMGYPLQKSTNGGQTWNWIDNMTYSNNTDYTEKACFRSAKEGLTSGINGKLLHTVDGGKNWEVKEVDIQVSQIVALNNNQWAILGMDNNTSDFSHINIYTCTNDLICNKIYSIDYVNFGGLVKRDSSSVYIVYGDSVRVLNIKTLNSNTVNAHKMLVVAYPTQNLWYAWGNNKTIAKLSLPFPVTPIKIQINQITNRNVLVTTLFDDEAINVRVSIIQGDNTLVSQYMLIKNGEQFLVNLPETVTIGSSYRIRIEPIDTLHLSPAESESFSISSTSEIDIINTFFIKVLDQRIITDYQSVSLFNSLGQQIPIENGQSPKLVAGVYFVIFNNNTMQKIIIP